MPRVLQLRRRARATRVRVVGRQEDIVSRMAGRPPVSYAPGDADDQHPQRAAAHLLFGSGHLLGTK